MKENTQRQLKGWSSLAFWIILVVAVLSTFGFGLSSYLRDPARETERNEKVNLDQFPSSYTMIRHGIGDQVSGSFLVKLDSVSKDRKELRFSTYYVSPGLLGQTEKYISSSRYNTITQEGEYWQKDGTMDKYSMVPDGKGGFEGKTFSKGKQISSFTWIPNP